MKLTVGSRLGPYEIVAPLGAGGMGEVYRAHDPRIGRDVAIKILPASFSEHQERLHRFQQEAHAAGVLNHPNLLTVHELGTHEASPFIVTELLEGETLRHRLAGAPLAPRRAIDYALQIANGLAAAHERGIVHRDLKPENIFVTKDGRVKILDFGLAKLKVPSTLTDTEAATVRRDTDPGTVLGTAGYMSPEQVRGDPVDHRSDIFSFGAILYEMLSGKRAFKKDSSIETMSAILKEEPPDLLEVNPHVLPALDRVVQHCLEKHPEARFQSARDLAFDLEAISGLSGPSGALAAGAARRRAIPLAIALAAVLAAAAFGYYVASLQRAAVPSFQRLTFRRGEVSAARFAPDAQSIVYSAAWAPSQQEIFVARPESPETRSLGLGESILLALSRSGELALQLQPRFQGGFTWLGTLARAPLAGGAPRELAENVERADWDPEGKDLAIVRTAGGKNRIEFPIGRTLYETAGWVSHLRVSPHDRSIAFIDHPSRGDDGGLIAVVSRDGKKKTLTARFASAQGLVWSPDGKKIWFTAAESGGDRALYSVTLPGKSQMLFAAPGVLTVQDIAPDGRVLLTQHTSRLAIRALAPGATEERDLSWLDWSLVRDLSADGRLMLFDETGEAGGKAYSVYLRKTDGSPAVRLGDGVAMGLSPDGKWALAIRRQPEPSQVFLYPTGAGEPRQITSDAISLVTATWFPDGKRILFLGNEPGQPLRLYVRDIAGGRSRAVAPPGVTAYSNAVSPDGKWIAASDSDRRVALYPLDGGTPRVLDDSLLGAIPCRWSTNGEALYLFRRAENPTRILRFDLTTGRTTVLHQFMAGDFGVVGLRVTPDGKYYAFTYYQDESQLYLATGLK